MNLPPLPLSDAAVVRRVLDGNEDAFAILVERYYDHYARLATHLTGNREDAEEALQDTFVRAYRNLGRYEERERFGAWLLRILVNQARSVTSRRRRRARLFAEHAATAFEPTSEAHPAERDAIREEVGRALAQLPAEQREAFLLYHVEGLDYEEMMAVTGLGHSALKMRVKRACDRLRTLLQEVHHG